MFSKINKVPLSRRGFLKRAPVAVAAAPVAVGEIARQELGGGPKPGWRYSQLASSVKTVSGSSVMHPLLDDDDYEAKSVLIKTWVKQSLLRGEVPPHMKHRMDAQARKDARTMPFDPDIQGMRSVSLSAKFRMQIDRSRQRAIDDMLGSLDYEDFHSGDILFRMAQAALGKL